MQEFRSADGAEKTQITVGDILTWIRLFVVHTDVGGSIIENCPSDFLARSVCMAGISPSGCFIVFWFFLSVSLTEALGLPLCLSLIWPHAQMPIICPISQQRIKHPVRGHECPHLHCFDLDSYISKNIDSESWRCPYCRYVSKLSLGSDQFRCVVFPVSTVSAVAAWIVTFFMDVPQDSGVLLHTACSVALYTLSRLVLLFRQL